jgi:hypothetical protein
MKYGFIEPKIDPTHYVLGQGNVNLQVLEPTGDWSDSLPAIEKQSVPTFDTYNCTGFGATNQVEIYLLKRYGIKANYSDRWVGIIAGTDAKRGGNDPHTVYEAIRKYGLIPEEMLPFDDSITTAEEYFSFKGADREACYEAGRKWLEHFDFFHEWVFHPDSGLTAEERLHNMRVALKYSPLCVAVYAWEQDERGVFVDVFGPNHWTTESGIKEFQEIFDTYEPYKKLVDQKIIYAKRISIEKKAPSTRQTFFQWIISFLKDLFS